MRRTERRTASSTFGHLGRKERCPKSSDGIRRDFIKTPLALAAGSLVMSSMLGSAVVKAGVDRGACWR
jgi:hypothetical protein